MFYKECLEQLQPCNHEQVFPSGETTRLHMFDCCVEASAACCRVDFHPLTRQEGPEHRERQTRKVNRAAQSAGLEWVWMRDRTELHLDRVCAEWKAALVCQFSDSRLWTGEMPMAASFYPGAVHYLPFSPFDERKRLGENTQIHTCIHTHTPWGSLRCVCVCEHLFWIRYPAPSRWAGGAGFTDRPLRTVACLDAGRVPITATWSDEEEKKKNTSRTSQPSEHFAYYPRTQAHTAGRRMNMSPLIEYSRQQLSCFGLEFKSTAG